MTMSSMIYIFMFTILLLLTVLYLFLRRKYSYWRQRNVKYLSPVPLFNFIFRNEFMGHIVQKICLKFPKEPYVGIYMGTVPALIVQSPEIINLITTKEFMHFSSRGLMDYMSYEAMGRSLMLSRGEEWRFARSVLTPMFSTLKLKNMFSLIQLKNQELERYLETEVGDRSFEARELMGSYAMACIVSCAFGITVNTFEGKNTFTRIAEIIFKFSRLRSVAFALIQIWPKVFYGLGFRIFPENNLVYFRRILMEVIESRRHRSVRSDFIDDLLSLKENSELEKKIDNEYIIAQCFAIFSGHESTASALSLILFELASHEDIQAKVHREIDDYCNREGKITYDGIKELPYLDACFKETLRKYPTIGVLAREVTKAYTLPSGLKLERGLRIYLPVYHLQHHPDYFPEPEIFRPERFYGDGKQDIKQTTYMPFGDGPRMCIGKRFSEMLSISGLVTILRKYKVVLAENMPKNLIWETTSIAIQSKTGIHLRLIPRSGK